MRFSLPQKDWKTFCVRCRNICVRDFYRFLSFSPCLGFVLCCCVVCCVSFFISWFGFVLAGVLVVGFLCCVVLVQSFAFSFSTAFTLSHFRPQNCIYVSVLSVFLSVCPSVLILTPVHIFQVVFTFFYYFPAYSIIIRQFLVFSGRGFSSDATRTL